MDVLPAAGSAPVEQPEFVTHDPEEAHAFLRAAYSENTMRVSGSQENFRMAHGSRGGGGFTVSTLAHSMAIQHRVQPLDQLLFCRVVDGRLERATAGQSQRFVAGDLFPVAAPDDSYEIEWEDGVSMQLVSVDAAALAAVSGLSEEEASHAHPELRSVDAAAMRHTLGVIDFIADDLLTNAEAMDSPLVRGNAARLLAASLLTTFPMPVEQAVTTVTAPAVRRAIDFIERNAERDISTIDIAAAAGVGPRGLQAAFRKHLDTTPNGYLRRVRLDRAHLELAATDPAGGSTVHGIAARWGFANAGRFATAYRQAYGVSPSHTLNG